MNVNTSSIQKSRYALCSVFAKSVKTFTKINYIFRIQISSILNCPTYYNTFTKCGIFNCPTYYNTFTRKTNMPFFNPPAYLFYSLKYCHLPLPRRSTPHYACAYQWLEPVISRCGLLPVSTWNMHQVNMKTTSGLAGSRRSKHPSLNAPPRWRWIQSTGFTPGDNLINYS